MRDKIWLGSSPADEQCAQVGTDGYVEQATKECNAYIAQLRRQFGPEPEGATLKISWEEHDAGNYAEVVVSYDTQNTKAINYAFWVEGESPINWDDEARLTLGL